MHIKMLAHRFYNKIVCVYLLCLFAFTGLFGAELDKQRPNVMIFITDDESWLERSAYGWSNLDTPNFDLLSKQGALFSRCYSSAPSCAPARATLLTGRNFWELEQGAIINAWLPTKFALLPDIMEKNGYFTGFTGKGWGPGVKPPEAPKAKNPAGNEFNSIKRDNVPEGINDVDYVCQKF